MLHKEIVVVVSENHRTRTNAEFLDFNASGTCNYRWALNDQMAADD
jgi:hypothetical protein